MGQLLITLVFLLIVVFGSLIVRRRLRAISLSGTPLDKQLTREQRLDALEVLITAKVAKRSLRILAIIGIAGAVAYTYLIEPKAGLEYLSYLMPSIGGGVAAFAIYKKNRPNLLFSISLACVALGMAFFIGSKKDAVLVSAWSIEALLGILLFYLCSIFFRFSRPKSQREVLESFGIAFVIAVVGYSMLFVLMNSGCLREDVVAKCTIYFWPTF